MIDVTGVRSRTTSQPQYRAEFDDDNYAYWYADENGDLTILPSGGGMTLAGDVDVIGALDVSGDLTVTGNILAGTDATYDVGADGATRFRDAWFERKATFGLLDVPAAARALVARTNWITASGDTSDSQTRRGGILLFGHGAAGSLTSLAYGGTSATPTATTSGQSLGAFVYGGWDGTNWAQGASVICFSSENWTTGGHGASFSFRSTGVGSAATPGTVMTIGPGGFMAVTAVLSVTGTTTMTGDLLFSADATYDVGKTGATRPRDGFFSRNVAIGGTLAPTGITTLGAPLTLKGYTVATLPAGVQGHVVFCTDLLAPGFLVAAVGGGAVVGPVFYNGAAWVAF